MRLRFRLVGCVVSGFVLSVPTPRGAHAQSAADSARADSVARKLNAVTVTESRAAGTTGGASAVVVKPEELRASPAPLLEEALRESPFVHVRQNSRGEMELSIRGSDSRQAAVLMDGVPLSIGWDHRTDPSIVPISGVQRLVIVRGLSSLLNGPNTLGGTIEVSHDEDFARATSGRLWGGAGLDEHAAYVTSIGGARELGGSQNGSLTVRGAVSRRARDGFALARGVADATSRGGLRTNSDLRETDGFTAMRWNGAAGKSAGLMLSAFDAERGVPPEEHIASPRLWRYPYHRRVVAALSARAATFSTPLGWGSFDIGAGYNAGRLRIDRYADRSYQSVDATELGDERTWTGRALLTHSLPRAARIKTALTFADVRYDETPPDEPTARYRQRLGSLGAEVELPLGARTTFASGLVYDAVDIPLSGGRVAEREAFDNLGWRAGLTHEANAEWILHSSLSRRSRFPSLRELYSGALDRFLSNPDLKPETLLGFEGGFTVDRRAGSLADMTVQMNAFYHHLDDAVVRITLPAPDRRFRRINRDRLESAGAEIMAGVAWGQNEARAVTLSGDALIQNIVLVDETAAGQPSRHAENNPERRGMIELGMPLVAGVRGFVNGRYTGTQYCLNADSGSEMTLAAKTEINLAAERRFVLSRTGSIRSLRAVMALDNAGNAAIYDQCGLPQPGRTLRLMFSFH